MVFKKIFFFSFLFFVFVVFQSNATLSPEPLCLVKTEYINNLEDFYLKSNSLKKNIADYSLDQIDIAVLRAELVDTRLAFKKIEFLLAYFDPELVALHINGAPLPKLEPKVPEIKVIPPTGLQILDELIFSDNPKESLNEIIALSDLLVQSVKEVVTYQKKQTFQHRHFMEAMRYEVIRIFTLGLTGFDTPGSTNALEESKVATEAMLTGFTFYENICLIKAPEEWQEVYRLLKESSDYLQKNTDFDTFDRLFFLKHFTNPLYASIYDFQKAMNIEFTGEVATTLLPHNYHSKNLFDADFLKTGFYTEIAEQDLLDAQKIALGKKLFFDPILSKNINMSCASCHHPDKAFTDGLPKSKSNSAGKYTQRNAPTLVNATFSTRFFWDLREYDLERQVKHVVHDSLEFNIDFIDLAERLKGSKEYVQLFKEAYENRDKYGISTWSISNSLAAYVNSLQSFNSSFDRYVRAESNDLSEDAKKGFNLFMGKAACGTCHFAPVFNGTVPPLYKESESEVLGVLFSYDTLNPLLDQDLGRIANGLPQEEAPHFIRSFKTVTIRNAALTAPYMHNGGFQTLQQVVDFYNRGGGAGMGLDVPFQTLPETPLQLSSEEMEQLIAFMNALTDIDGLLEQPTTFPSFEHPPQWNNRIGRRKE